MRIKAPLPDRGYARYLASQRLLTFPEEVHRTRRMGDRRKSYVDWRWSEGRPNRA